MGSDYIRFALVVQYYYSYMVVQFLKVFMYVCKLSVKLLFVASENNIKYTSLVIRYCSCINL